ncbi:MAG: efflux RND transporter periplasmic adaptor subunit [Xanthomonadaceae bacterium]|nr:efflux RND transporter periplasmic adaptor subunit [Xanthomonadaceae bacterium]
MTRLSIRTALALALLTLLLGAGAGYLLGKRQPAQAPAAAAAAAERQVLYWFDPMVPDQHFDKPGKSPFMDMELQPRYADESVAGGVQVAAGNVQSLGLRAVAIQRSRRAAQISASGSIAWNLRHEQRLDAGVDARIARLWVRAPFERVRAGQPVAALDAPAWASAIAEYLALREASSPAAKALLGDARQRLRQLGLGEADIRAAERGGQRGRQVVLHAPAAGVVTELPVREGQWLRAGDLLARINGDDDLWLEAAIPQAQAAALVAGAEVSVRIDSLGAALRRGVVEQMLPQVDPRSRTVTARIVLDNADGALVPGQFANVAIALPLSAPALWVPDEALILTGAESRLALDEGEGRYRVVAVTTGRHAQGQTEIVKGLSEGARVVVSGQFLLDSEASMAQLPVSPDDAADTPDAPPAEAPHAGHEPTPEQGTQP